MPSVNDVILHCQKQIKKEPADEKLLHYLNRLDRLRVTMEDLMETGVGKTVNSLSRRDGDVGNYAAKLVKKWKDMVSAVAPESEDESRDSSSSGEEEDEERRERSEDEEEDGVKPQSYAHTNGHGHEEDQGDSGEEFSRNDSDEDRLCIADEELKAGMRNRELNISIKEEKIRPASPEDSDAYDDVHEGTEQDYECNLEIVKPERLSESEGSTSDEKNIPKLKIKVEHHSSRHHKRSKEYDHERSKEKSRNSSESREDGSHRSSEHKKDKYSSHSHSKKHKKDKTSESKEERSKRKEKSKKQSKDRTEIRQDEKHKKTEKEHRDKAKGESRSHCSHTHKSKHKDKRDSSAERKRDKSERKRKDGRDEKSSDSSSPDRKKLKLDVVIKKERHDVSLEKKPSIQIDEEIDSGSGVKFDELLGCLDNKLTKTKEKSSKEKHKEKSKKHSSKDKEKEEVTKLVRRSDVKIIDKKKSIIQPTLNISPNYSPVLTRMMPPKPPSTLSIFDAPDPGNYWEQDNHHLMNSHTNRTVNSEEALSSMMSSRNQRTKVFSGRSVMSKGVVPRLFDLCMQVIQDNIGELGYSGGVPYEILKPALERATAPQLFQIEEFNPYLIGQTDELWQFHCNREFKARPRQEMESWRELYERCIHERQEKFAKVRERMLHKVDTAEPVRKAKLAYVEPIGGTRFNRSKAATIKNGMKSLKIKEEKGPKKGVGSSASAGFNNPTDSSKIVEEHAVIISGESRAGHAPASSSRGESTARAKPKRAPLMAKTMKFIKTLKRR